MEDIEELIVRSASHAGSWYTDNAEELENELTNNLENADFTLPSEDSVIRGVIGPHAGLRWSGPTAAWAYKNIKNIDKIKRVFLLGPAHRTPVDGGALTKWHVFETPIGELVIDREVTENLAKNKNFSYYTIEEDELEHSLEMHFTYIKKVFNNPNLTLVPIVVGSISFAKAQALAAPLSEYFKDEENFFVISSDFCHWGLKFGYMPFDEKYWEERGVEVNSVNDYIKALDFEGIQMIESQSAKDFQEYLGRTKNTICGRNPITVYLEAIRLSGVSTLTKNVRYSQSGPINSKLATSVSYASFYTVLKNILK